MLCTSFPSALPPFSIIAGWDHSQAKNLQNPAGRPWGQVGSGVTQAGQRWLAPVADTESENPRFLLRAFPNRPLLPRGGVTASRLSRGPSPVLLAAALRQVLFPGFSLCLCKRRGRHLGSSGGHRWFQGVLKCPQREHAMPVFYPKPVCMGIYSWGAVP